MSDHRPALSRRTLIAGAAGLAGAASSAALRGASPAATAATVPASVTDPLRTFDFTGVRLLPSRWRSQQDQVADDYLHVPTDDYLHGFRVRAGLPAPGRELGGWYSDDVFHDFGQIVSGLARLHAGSGRPELAAKVAELVEGFVECIEPDGYFFYTRHPNSVHYVYEKVLCGLLDAWLYCEVDAALPALHTVTDWAVDPAHLGRVREHGGGWEGEWYTLSENLYRAHLATGDPRYLEFGRVWEYRSLWDRFFAGENIFQTPDGQPVGHYHAYSHVNSLAGLGAGHRVTGDPYYLTALRNAYDVLRGTHLWSTGGYGPFEQLLPDAAARAATLQPWHNHFETLCGSWAALKVSKYLVTATGQARYGDWAEQMLYNGVGATIPMAADGRVQYYSAYSPRGGRKVLVSPWSCCTGTRPQGVADYTDQVFLHAERRLMVNLFLPARLEWPTGDGRIVARVVTDFPASSRVRLELDEVPDVGLTLGFRAPGWLSRPPRLLVDGAWRPARPDADGWIAVTRRWHPGDRLELDLPMELETTPVLPDRPAPVAVTYGPVSVAYAAGRNPARDLGVDQLVRRSQRAAGPDLAWRVSGTSVTARPFFAYGEDELYYLHLDPDAGLYVRLDGQWGSLSFISVTSFAGDTASCEFDGTGLRWVWVEGESNGIADVEVDGSILRAVDLYGPPGSALRTTEITGLAPGRHHVRLICSGRHNPASGGISINVVDVEAIPPA
ncbi:beta-L-arabinofuranosidase domain-containing protein [Jiangella asiatica]|uniref:beta-L-arabinofuranosidase domain-containing protein n=1 Tax=Jiangella asiatica TaxID=2530372 RepID=UPI0013A5CBDF|nr:beta-L-arabinofuranosidase domain-containing protein [Jiangella asiatica]